MAPNGSRAVRVMTDANVLVAGNAFPRWPYEVLRHALKGRFPLILCPYVIEEARRTLNRVFPHQASRLERFLRTCPHEKVPDPSAVLVRANKALCRSIKDVPVILAARRGKVDYLVTSDKDLTVDDETTKILRQWFRPILPASFLKEVMGWTSEQLETVRHRTWEKLQE